MKKTVLYARVSTRNNGQDPETQLLALREYAQARRFEITGEYVDVGISGTKESRPELGRLMKDASRRRLDTVLVTRFDRFARSTRHLVLALEEFNGLELFGAWYLVLEAQRLSSARLPAAYTTSSEKLLHNMAQVNAGTCVISARMTASVLAPINRKSLRS